MPQTQHIIPAIIPESLSYLRSRLRDVHGIVKRVQIDVMDGSYAPTTSWPYVGVAKDAFEAARREDAGLPYWQDFNFEIDLLLREPEKRIDEWALAGVSSLIFHVESTEALSEIAKECFSRRIEMAFALKPSTDISVLEPYIDQLLFVQVMGSERIGYHGVTLSDKALETIRAIHKRWPTLTIGVDIGVSAETLPALMKAGASRFAAGSSVFNYTSPAGAILHLESIVSKEGTS
jgi:ribulose-phosphate 3-epimerase